MQKIGDILGQMAKGREERLLGPERAALTRLIRLPSTSSVTSQRAELELGHRRVLAELEHEMEQAEPDAVLAAAKLGAKLEREHQAAIEILDRQIQDGDERDRMLQLRPSGCVCLGTGGTGQLLPFVSYVLWEFWCVCPESLAMQAIAAKVDAEVRAIQADEDAKLAAAQTAGRIARANLPRRLAELTWRDFEGDPGKQRALAHLRHIVPGGHQRGAFLFGGLGTGKSTLAALACRQWAKAGGESLYLVVSELLEMLRPGGQDMAEDVASSQSDLMQRLLGTGLLVLDDIGANTATGWVRERLFMIVNRRYDHNRMTILTSNYDLFAMAKRLAGQDDRIEGERIAWRIKETCEIVEVGGQNYRAMPPSADLVEGRPMGRSGAADWR